MFEILILLVLLPFGLAIVAFLTWSGTHNRLASLDSRCDSAFADIDVMLKRRHDLLPALVETTKGFAGHERGIMEKVVAARAAALRANGSMARLEAETQLGNTITSVLAAAEHYPDLKSSQHFLQLRAELADSEDRLAGARRYFNMCVEEYNSTLRQFPGSFVGPKMQLGKRRMYDIGVERVLLDEPVAVSFG